MTNHIIMRCTLFSSLLIVIMQFSFFLFADNNTAWQSNDNQNKWWPFLDACLKQSNKTDYIATVNLKTTFHNRFNNASFFRKVDKNDFFVFLRAELYYGKTPVLILIHNRQGIFAFHPEGRFFTTLKHSRTLFILESLNAPPYEYEIKHALKYSTEELTYKGKKCLALRTEFDADMDDLPLMRGMTGCPFIGKSALLKTHPHYMEFIIDKSNKMICSRRHWNSEYSLLYELSLESYETMIDWEKTGDVFSVPEKEPDVWFKDESGLFEMMKFFGY